jgi:2-keto-4-pentenoate hydratase/2-oxohepta-3-ene-1,7-dioic acid hydratase in catechol pathway
MRLARVVHDGEWLASVRDECAYLLAPWSQWRSLLMRRDLEGDGIPLSSVRLLPPVSESSKIICLGLNYRDHANEAGGTASENPGLFTKFADALVGCDAPVLRPKVSDSFDYEGEIAVVIGRPGRHIDRESALDHVCGYTIMLDGSVRDFQGHSISAGKNFWQSGALGPWILTTDEMPDPSLLSLETRLNGKVVQAARAEHMIYDVSSTIAYISKWTPLAPGDVIATGTPAGVGAMRTPPLWMKPGDLIEVEVPAIGTLRNAVAAEGERN